MTASSTTTLRETDHEAITELLLGRRIVSAETTFRVDGHTYSAASGRLTLDDGTQVYVFPNEGGCSCGAGDYDLTHLASVDNIITAVRVTEDTQPNEYEGGPTQYRIFVVADATEVNVATIEGDDGNGHYGTGFDLVVVSA